MERSSDEAYRRIRHQSSKHSAAAACSPCFCSRTCHARKPMCLRASCLSHGTFFISHMILCWCASAMILRSEGGSATVEEQCASCP